MEALDLPDGYRARTLIDGDAQAVADLVAATELAVDGQIEIDVSDVESDWARPTFDRDSMAIGVEASGSLVAFGEVFHGRSEVMVHPGHEGRGVGSALMRWSWKAARLDGAETVGQTLSDAHRSAISLLGRHGYERTFTSWILRIDLTDDLPEPQLPDGFAIRDWAPGKDDEELFEVIETAFSEWKDRGPPQTLEDWRASVLEHVAVRPDVTPVVTEGARIVGAAVGMNYEESPLDEGWVQQLAVRREVRGRGLGTALLHESFRRFRDLGQTQAGLSTDSRTGALALYEQVGMRVDRSYTRWTKRLGSD